MNWWAWAAVLIVALLVIGVVIVLIVRSERGNTPARLPWDDDGVPDDIKPPEPLRAKSLGEDTIVGGDLRLMPEDARGATMGPPYRHGDGRECSFHARLRMWTPDGMWECLRIHLGTSETPTEPSFECPRCHRVSHHPMDLRFGYCGHCKQFTGDPSDVVIHGTLTADEQTAWDERVRAVAVRTVYGDRDPSWPVRPVDHGRHGLERPDFDAIRARWSVARLAGQNADEAGNGWDESKMRAMTHSWQDVAVLLDYIDAIGAS